MTIEITRTAESDLGRCWRTIEVTRTTEADSVRWWRAVVRLPRQIDWRTVGYGVNGQQTDSGAWVEGYGFTPETAIQNAMATIGKAVMGMSEPDPPKPVEP
jgi:hypothetical protein